MMSRSRGHDITFAFSLRRNFCQMYNYNYWQLGEKTPQLSKRTEKEKPAKLIDKKNLLAL